MVKNKYSFSKRFFFPDKKIFFICGEDYQKRQIRIENIKKQIFQGKSKPEILTLYGKDLGRTISLEDLKIKIFSHSFSGIRLIIFKDATALKESVKNFIVKEINKILSCNYLIFDMDFAGLDFRKIKNIRDGNFIRSLSSYSCIYNIPSAFPEVSLYNFKKSIRKRDLVKSILLLRKLIRENNEKKYLMIILGVLIDEFSHQPSPSKRREAFSLLWDTDRKLKTTNLTSLLLERLLVKLLKDCG